MSELAATHRLQPPLEMRFKAEALEEYGLPDILYPISFEAFDKLVGHDGALPLPVMLHGLQQCSAVGDADWQGLEPALDRLAELLAPDDDRPVVSAAGPDWWVEIGPVDLSGPIVTVQRKQELVAALSRRDDGRLRLVTFRPLDGKSARLVIGLALRPHPDDGTVCMRENNWEYALDCSAGTGQTYAFVRGEAHLSLWERGIGLLNDGSIDSDWRAQRTLPQRWPAKVAMELGVAYAFSD